ncbi:uncharacterized protein K460DRAFT_395669 [Cucurbitaria berberidis CBS 394.84]|uniref:Uncharacterized protein n=1 Tax=Cucurbitaria berberidis CBS 394.84 TaxID=1168544 RepID=A0A9P4L8K7_9PLEO|nr:uncharacterized protein K460DRAFT_395669 [Cucurbitaria berberidis CBS 394.84]KAF1846201.1 hypothetical protein K460DRAFT_395669 [Cucurbitaria berberidis CBS 394.84]
MASTIFVQPTPLEIIKRQAKTYADVARLWVKQWLKSHRKLFLLAQCARYGVFAKNPLQVNALILRDLRCKPLRECLQEVLKLQRELRTFEKKVKESIKEERKCDAQFWALARTMKQ